jgi:tetratricopeptide (TPR) repeat protein
VSAHRPTTPPYVRAVFDAANRAFEAGQYADALEAVRAAEAARPHDAPLRLALAGVYIDAGSSLNDLAVINEGMRRLEAKVAGVVTPADEYEAGLVYNLANGYAARQRVRLRAALASTQAGAPAPAKEALSLEEDTRSQKILYRRALTVLGAEHTQPSPDAHVNFGNLLMNLGRSVEALDQYEAALHLDPDFAPALLRSTDPLADLSHLVRSSLDGHWLDIWQRLQRALDQRSELTRIIGPGALRQLEKNLEEANASLDANGGVDAVRARVAAAEEHITRDHAPPARHVVDWAIEHLLLTVHAATPRHERYWVDDAFPEEVVAPLGTPTADEEAAVDGMVNRLNELKADFAAARYVFSLADQGATAFGSTDMISRYGHIKSPAHFDTATALLKLSYRAAADVLDKAAGVVNALYGPWTPRERAVSFVTLWYEKQENKRGLSAPATAAVRRNVYVRAQFDLSRDWTDADLSGHLRDLRHALTHRYVPVYADPLAITFLGRSTRGVAPAEVRSPTDVHAVSRFMLDTARSATLYALAAVDLEARLRRDEPNAPVTVKRWRPQITGR